MKKQSILFLAGGLLALASCNNNAENANMSQAQIDSMVNVKVAEMTVQMQASNDSMINALAQVKADSMIAAMKGSPAPVKGHTDKPRNPVTPAEPVKSTPETNKGSVTDRKSGQQNTQNTNVTDRKSGQAASQNTNVTDRKSKQPGK